MIENNKKIKLCIVAHLAYHALKGSKEGHIGGVENQTALMARWFASQGHEVSVLTWNESGKREEIIDGIRILTICQQNEGIPGIRFFTPRWSGLTRAMAAADADLYYQNCAEYVTGQVALWCRLKGRKFIYSVASDPDCDPSLPAMTKKRERLFYKYGLHHADRVIVQNKKQHTMLEEGFGRDSIILPMACEGAKPDERADPPFEDGHPHRVIWVGRITPVKQPEWLLELAKCLPDIEFDMVGGHPRETEYFHGIMEQAHSIPNITVHGKLCREEIYPLYRRASLLCCTSEFEGFPNTFLEAWSFGLPIVSTVDPDNLISGGLGQVASSVEGLAEAIRSLLSAEKQWRAISDRCREYYENNHEVDSVMRCYEALMHETLEEGKQ